MSRRDVLNEFIKNHPKLLQEAVEAYHVYDNAKYAADHAEQEMWTVNRKTAHELAFQCFGLKEGDDVIFRRGGKTLRGKVTSINGSITYFQPNEPVFWPNPVDVLLYRKDGKLGERTAAIWLGSDHWEKAE